MIKFAVVTATLTILLVSASAFAFDFDISPKLLKTGAEQLVNYVIYIENDQNYADEFRITVDGPNLAWIQSSLQDIRLQPGQGDYLNLTFYPTGSRRGIFNYTATAQSIRYHDIPTSKEFQLYVMYPVNIASFYVDKFDGQLEMIMDLEAIGQQSCTILFQIKDSSGMLVSDFMLDIEIEESKRITKYIEIKDLLAGDYVITASIEDTKLYKDASFTVEPISKVTESRKLTSNPLWKVVEVTIENQGNIVEQDYVYYQEIPSDAFTGFVTRPENCFEEGEETKCMYVIDKIMPGMTAKIVYRIDLWPILGGYALGLMGMVSGAGLLVKRTTRPKIRKKSLKKSGSEHTVFLELKNPFRTDIENIVVRDWISPLAVVVNQFDSVKPVIRKSDAGTELIWKLDKIEKKDERILSYKIRTMINGEIKMPKAYIRYKNRKGEKGKVFSNPLVIK